MADACEQQTGAGVTGRSVDGGASDAGRERTAGKCDWNNMAQQMTTISFHESLPMLKQACALPYRVASHGVEFCLVTSRSRRRWGFPKGLIDPGETPEQTACKEAFEEAGLQGQIVGPLVGQYHYIKCETPLEVVGYLMLVTAVLPIWPEDKLRQRRWAAASEALHLLAHRGQRDLLAAAMQRLAQTTDKA